MKYIVSACLAGVRCRYDGRSNAIDSVINLVKRGSALPVCPEVLGGLTVPRSRCELHLMDDGSKEIRGEDGNNYTEQFLLGASISLDIACKHGINRAILKSKSPSCGCGLIYDGTFTGKLVEGNGITASLLMQSGIEVFTEEELQKLCPHIKTST